MSDSPRTSRPRPEDGVGRRPVLEHELLAEGAIFDLVRDKVAFSGTVSFRREYLRHPGAVAIAAFDGTRVLLIRQYRHAAGMTMWELPAGLMDSPGEALVDAARRELDEETGYAATSWHSLVDLFSSPGCSDEAIRIFLARDPHLAGDSDFERTDEEAEIETAWVDLDAAVDAALDGRLTNGTTITGLLALQAARHRGFEGLRPADADFDARPRVRGLV